MVALAVFLTAAAMLTPAGSPRAVEGRSSSALPTQWLSIRAPVSYEALSGDGRLSLSEMGYEVVPVPSGRTGSDYATELRDSRRATLVQPDVMVVASDTTPSDTLYADFQAQYLGTIGAEAAWDLSTGRETTVIAFLDTGVDLNHPEFDGRFWTNVGEVPGNGLDDDSNGCVDDINGCRFVNLTQERASACGYESGTPDGAVSDDHGRDGSAQHSHGTTVAGIAAARGDNGRGIAGVAWNVQVMVVKVLDCGVPSQGGAATGDLTNVAQGIDYARRMGADIINVSLSTRGDISDLTMLRDAVGAAQADGVIVVAAVGNHASSDSNVRPGFPAAYSAEPAYPLVVAVGGIRQPEWKRVGHLFELRTRG